MKKFTILAAIAISLLFSSCGNRTTMNVDLTPSEIENYIAQNPTLPDVDKNCLNNKEFTMGMQAETVRFMLGNPKKITKVQKPWAVQEVWLYKAGGKKVFTIEDGGVVDLEAIE